MATSWWQWLVELLIKFVDLITFGKMVGSEPNELTINVKFSKDLTIPVKITPEMTVHEIKQQLADNLNIPQEELRIIFAGKELLDQTVLQVGGTMKWRNEFSGVVNSSGFGSRHRL